MIYEINRLYRNTGKKVVIITHSLGGLLVLGNLLRMREDIKNKVIEQIYLFSSKLNVFCDIKQFTLFSDSKCKVLRDKYEKNYNK